MFEKSALMFLYAVSPVHMGSGTGLGAVDNPIQREPHTLHPILAGSGLKGALRHAAGRKMTEEDIKTVFGPDTKQADTDRHAGAVAVSDAQIVLFPVRSLRRSFVYATCPTALARVKRAAGIAKIPCSWEVPDVAEDECVSPEAHGSDAQVVLEAFQFRHRRGAAEIASWLATHAFPADTPDDDYFRKKMKADLCVLHDDRFNHFVRHSTIVEPHVRINDETGTADDGGLFYSESLPPESVLLSLVAASRSHRDANVGADVVLQKVHDLCQQSLLQFGGDATTGRGQIQVNIVREGASNA